MLILEFHFLMAFADFTNNICGVMPQSTILKRDRGHGNDISRGGACAKIAHFRG